MPTANLYFWIFSTIFVFTIACNKTKKTEQAHQVKLSEMYLPYTCDGLQMKSFVCFDQNATGKLPIVYVIHEWWGLNDYAKSRARGLANLGYLAVAIDMYGNDQTGEDPTQAGVLATPFYKIPQMSMSRFNCAKEALNRLSNADFSKSAAIGYCFGGAQVLNLARLGADLKGVVSFHGNLTTTPADKNLLKSKILVCHGGADPFVPMSELESFKHQMDSIGANYEVKVYEGASHAFTNPMATVNGTKFNIPIKYDPVADTSSWHSMKIFLENVLHP